MGFDPEYYEIEGKVRASSWNVQVKNEGVQTFYAFKGIVRRRHPERDEWYDKLLKKYQRKNHLKKRNSKVILHTYLL